MNTTRRQLLVGDLGLVVGAGAGSLITAAVTTNRERGEQEEVSAPEDLMREHGVLDRVLLIYEMGRQRLHANEDVGPEVFHRAASLVRRFVEDYHERLEERFIFPEFEQHNRQAELVRVLRRQHAAGRSLTDIVLRTATPDYFHSSDARRELAAACAAFIRMYRPHAAREDTVLFPALHDIFPARQMRELGERFEQEEDRLFGADGFQRTVGQVAEIERQLGIEDLDQFTPK